MKINIRNEFKVKFFHELLFFWGLRKKTHRKKLRKWFEIMFHHETKWTSMRNFKLNSQMISAILDLDNLMTVLFFSIYIHFFHLSSSSSPSLLCSHCIVSCLFSLLFACMYCIIILFHLLEGSRIEKGKHNIRNIHQVERKR